MRPRLKAIAAQSGRHGADTILKLVAFHVLNELQGYGLVHSKEAICPSYSPGGSECELHTHPGVQNWVCCHRPSAAIHW
jgi:hypothetical protein